MVKMRNKFKDGFKNIATHFNTIQIILCRINIKTWDFSCRKQYF